jgi:hypothetical protein
MPKSASSVAPYAESPARAALLASACTVPGYQEGLGEVVWNLQLLNVRHGDGGLDAHTGNPIAFRKNSY